MLLDTLYQVNMFTHKLCLVGDYPMSNLEMLNKDFVGMTDSFPCIFFIFNIPFQI